jgi:hypothetical protein
LSNVLATFPLAHSRWLFSPYFFARSLAFCLRSSLYGFVNRRLNLGLLTVKVMLPSGVEHLSLHKSG